MSPLPVVETEEDFEALRSELRRRWLEGESNAELHAELLRHQSAQEPEPPLSDRAARAKMWERKIEAHNAAEAEAEAETKRKQDELHAFLYPDEQGSS
jgi:hypothetical protein